MSTSVTPEQRRGAKQEIVKQVEQGASAKVARQGSSVPMHRATNLQGYCIFGIMRLY